LETAEIDASLIRSAIAGDARAFAGLCETCRHRFWRIVCSVAGASEAEDLAQEAVVRAWCARRTYRADAPFDAWLCRIAVNAAHDYRRSAWRRRVILWQPSPREADHAAEPLDDTVARRDLQRRVRQAVMDLPARQRAPIWLHFIEGYSLAEVARLDGVSETTVRSRVQAGRRRLKAALTDVWLEGVEAGLRMEPEARGCEA